MRECGPPRRADEDVFLQDAKGDVEIRLALLRLPQVGSDVLLTFHTPSGVGGYGLWVRRRCCLETSLWRFTSSLLTSLASSCV